jgi:predicted small lipoprotein YifL
MYRLVLAVTLALGAGLLAGCGQKGPLTLPRAQPAATTPASAASTPAPAATVAPAAASSSR